MKPLTLIDEAVLARYIPYRRVVQIIDYSYGLELQQLRLKGHVLTLQTNQNERLLAVKNSLFKYNLDNHYFILFVGDEKHFSKANVLSLSPKVSYKNVLNLLKKIVYGLKD